MRFLDNRGKGLTEYEMDASRRYRCGRYFLNVDWGRAPDEIKPELLIQ